MSDRFVFDDSKQRVEKQFGVQSERKDYYESDFNITPGSLIPVILNDDEGEKEIRKALWGLLPPDAEDERSGAGHYEVSMEAISEEEWKMEALKTRRCLIPAQGFYKWKTTEKRSTPFYIRLLEDRLMAIAGIYSIWESPSGRKAYSCSMLTTDANVLIQPVGQLMPVIVEQEDYEEWLQAKELNEEVVSQITQPYPMSKMAVNRVSEAVNDVNNNGPELVQPIPK